MENKILVVLLTWCAKELPNYHACENLKAALKKHQEELCRINEAIEQERVNLQRVEQACHRIKQVGEF